MAEQPPTQESATASTEDVQVNGVSIGEEGEVSGQGEETLPMEQTSDSNLDQEEGGELHRVASIDSAAEQKESDGDKQENIPETPVTNLGGRGRKRKVSESSTEEEELRGFDPPPEPSPLTKYRIDKIEKIENSIREAEQEAQKLRVNRPPAKRPHLASPAYASDVSSRPSSGLSVRSESDLMGSDQTNSAANSPQPVKGRKSAVNLNNPLFRVPMEHGWKRELVYRAVLDQYQRRQGDIYYYTPQGKKLRSTREVSEHLVGTGLTIDHFTFFKEPLGLDDPEKEIIRDAKLQKTRTDSPVSVPQEKPTVSPIIREGKRTVKPKGPKGASPDRAIFSQKLLTPIKVKSFGSRLSGKTATPSPAKNTVKEQAKGKKEPTGKAAKNLVGSSYMETDYGQTKSPEMYPMMRMRSFDPQTGEMSPKSGRELCSIHCASARGQIPSLQCSICLCLYHNACEGITEDVQHFMCKSCQSTHRKVLPSPPTLTPLAAMKPVQKPFPSVLPPPPQLQRIVKDSALKIPQPVLVPVMKKASVQKMLKTVPTLVPAKQFPSETTGKTAQGKKKSIVGSVTTWLPSSSSIRMSTKPSATPSASPTIPLDILQGRYPQTIAIINGKKYIIVPKHSVLNVPQLSSSGPPTPKQAETTPKFTKNLNPSTTMAKNIINAVKAEESSTSEQNLNIDKNIGGELEPGEIKMEYTEGDSKVGGMKDMPSDNVPSHDKVIETTETVEKKKEKSPTKAATPKTPYQKTPKKAPTSENGTPAVKRGRGRAPADKKDVKPNAEIGLRTLVESGIFVNIFAYLNKRELAAAAQVCRGWRELTYTPSLWKTVRMKNSQVTDWQALTAILKRQKTRHLDLRKMLLPPDDTDRIWFQFTKHIGSVESLQKIELCRCPSYVLEKICKALPKLQALTATSLKCATLNPEPFADMTNLTDLRIKGLSGLSLRSDLRCLEKLTKLKHLSLTSIKDLEKLHCVSIGKLTMLECLELGECTFSGEVGTALLSPLQRLTRLRLEKCPSDSSAIVLSAAAQLPHVTHLELINFEIKPGFEDALASCCNVKRLLLIPMYISQSATTNRCILLGVLRLKTTLTHLVWGVTIELLRVTELFIDQCERPGGDGGARSPKPAKKQPLGESIPVLKPVPGMTPSVPEPDHNGGDVVKVGAHPQPAQVEILPLPTLQRLLNNELPDTRLKILRIPFHATWRQTLSDLD